MNWRKVPHNCIVLYSACPHCEVEYPKVSRVPSLPPARPLSGRAPLAATEGGPVQRSVARITGQEDLASQLAMSRN